MIQMNKQPTLVALILQFETLCGYNFIIMNTYNIEHSKILNLNIRISK